MILESLIQFLSTALAFTLLLTLFSAFVFYGRYKANNSRPKAVAQPDVEVETADTQGESAPLRPAAGRKRLHFAPAKEA